MTMKRGHNILGVAIFAMLMAFILLMLSVAPFAYAEGRSDKVTKTADFDFESGCLDDADTVRDGEAVSVYLSDSAYGTLTMKDFRTCDITFYAQVSGVDDTFQVVIEDDDDTENYVLIEFWARNGNAIDITVIDHTSLKQQEDEVSVAIDIVGEWVLIDLAITNTPTEEDGTKKGLSVEVGGNKAYSGWELQSYEFQGKIKERKYNDLTWKVPTSGDELWADTIEADCGEGSSHGYTWVFLVVVGMSGYFIVAYRFELWPLGKHGVIRKRLR